MDDFEVGDFVLHKYRGTPVIIVRFCDRGVDYLYNQELYNCPMSWLTSLPKACQYLYA